MLTICLVLQAIEREETFRKEGRKQKKAETDNNTTEPTQAEALPTQLAPEAEQRLPPRTNVAHTGNFF